MSDEDKVIVPAEAGAIAIPEGTQFVIVDLDHENERVQIEFTLDDRLLRAWVPAANFQRMTTN